MEALQTGVVAYPVDLVDFLLQELAIVHLQVFFEGVDDLRTGIALGNGVIVQPECLFDLDQEYNKQVANQLDAGGRSRVISLVDLPVKLFEVRVLIGVEDAGRDGFRQEKRKIVEDGGMDVSFQE